MSAPCHQITIVATETGDFVPTLFTAIAAPEVHPASEQFTSLYPKV